MNARRDEPSDIYLTEDELRDIFHDYIRSVPGAADRFRSNPRLMKSIQSGPKVVREQHRHWIESQENKAEENKAAQEPTGIPHEVSRRLRSHGLFMGPTQRQAVEWATGPAGPRGNMQHLGILIYGPTWGKTIAACMTISPTHAKVGRGRRAFVSEANLLRAVLAKPTREAPRPCAPYDHASRLVVDHMGALQPGPKATREVIEFLRERWERGLSNVLTTRKTVAEFQDHYGLDAWATVERFCTLCEARKAN